MRAPYGPRRIGSPPLLGSYMEYSTKKARRPDQNPQLPSCQGRLRQLQISAVGPAAGQRLARRLPTAWQLRNEMPKKAWRAPSLCVGLSSPSLVTCKSRTLPCRASTRVTHSHTRSGARVRGPCSTAAVAPTHFEQLRQAGPGKWKWPAVCAAGRARRRLGLNGKCGGAFPQTLPEDCFFWAPTVLA